MKIVPKLTAALLLGTCAILGVNGYLRIRREVAAFEADRRRDHEMIARSLAAATSAAWQLDGEVGVRASVEATNKPFARIQIRWLGAGGPEHVEVAPLVFAMPGEPLSVDRVDATGKTALYTYMAVDVDGDRKGVIELVEPADAQQRFFTTALMDTTSTAVALALLSAVLSFVMGHWLVGKPVRVLADQARRIGQGDFSGRVVLSQNDELCDLAAEMNAMCERLVTTVDQLRHADRLATVGKLASGVAHELGTPLNVISARAEMIVEGTTPAESTEYAGVIRTAADKMSSIIRQLLQFGRRETIRAADTDVQALARETLELLQPLAAKKNVLLELEPATVSTVLSVDAGQLQQVITNLVMNAIQATSSEGVVKLRWYEQRAGALCLDVRDDGAGIRPEDVPRIFEPFFTTKDVGQGTGLGLAVSHGIVSEHGGTITVKTTSDAGSTFTVSLPRTSS